MNIGPFMTIDIIALIFLGISFLLSIKLYKTIGKGKDTGLLNLLFIVIILNVIWGLLLVSGGYMKYLGDYLTYVRLTDITLMVSGIVLATSIFKVNKGYEKLIQKNDPNA